MSIKFTSLLFIISLVGVHLDGELQKKLWLPMSLFRDGGQWAAGYLLFGLLLAVCGFYLRLLIRLQREVDTFVAGFAALLLVIVGLTPSQSGMHQFCSFGLLAVLYGYYALLLRESESFWFMPHLAVPVVLLLGTQLHSYGLWQKSIILYFVVVANVHYCLIVGGLPALGGRRCNKSRLATSRQRKVYVLEPGRVWAKQPSR